MNQLEEYMRQRDYLQYIDSITHEIGFVDVRGYTSEISVCVREEYEDLNHIDLKTTTKNVETIDHLMKSQATCAMDFPAALTTLQAQKLDKDSLTAFFASITADPASDNTKIDTLELGMRPLCSSILDSLEALSVSAEILSQCPSATMPMRISNTSLQKGNWFPKQLTISDSTQDLLSSVSRAHSFACLCMLESGGIDVDPSYFERAFALSAGNSIYVAKVLLDDPTVDAPESSIVRIVGNIGVPGISVIVSPDALRVADAPDDPRAIQHQPYDQRREDSFSNVTLHLSMTDWRVPIPTGTVGVIDQDLFLTEAVVSAHDGGKWYADIDVLAAKGKDMAMPMKDCDCNEIGTSPTRELVCIDTFDELLELPDIDAVLRAKGNWAARLAALCIWRQKKLPAYLSIVEDINDQHCWKCIERQMEDHHPHDTIAQVSLIID